MDGFLFLVLAAAFLVLFWVTLRLEWGDRSPTTVLLAYGPPIALAAASAVFLAAPFRRRKAFAQTLLTILLAAVVLEVALSANNYHISLSRAKGFAAETRAEKVWELRQRGIRAFPQVVTKEVVAGLPGRAFDDGGRLLLPLAGLSGVTTVYCNEGGKWIVFESDEFGFRNPHGIWSRREVDVALVGASYFLGGCEEEEDTIAGALRRRYASIVNAGVGGAGPLHQLAMLREYVVPLRPPLVLWQGGHGGTPPRLSREHAYPVLMRYLEPGFRQDLARQAAFLDAKIAEWVEKRLPIEREYALGLHRLARRGWAGWPASAAVDVPLLRNLRSALGLGMAAGRAGQADDGVPAAPAAEGPSLERIMGEAKRSVEGYGGRLIVVLIPVYEDAAGLSDERSRAEELSLLHRLDIPVIDVVSPFRALPDPAAYYTPLRVHANAPGYRLMGKVIVEGLERLQ